MRMPKSASQQGLKWEVELRQRHERSGGNDGSMGWLDSNRLTTLRHSIKCEAAFLPTRALEVCFAFVCVPWLRLDGVGRGRRFALRLGVSLRTPYHRGIRYHV